MAATVSLVMSDIVDSTRRWNTDETAMAGDLERHDRLVRAAVDRAGGTVFKHTGDGMIAVFDDASTAVAAAVEIQQVIGATTWQHVDGIRVRAAVHTGVVHPRDGDLFGTAVNLVARLLGMCPAGAVLVSGVAAACAPEPPDGVRLRHVGSVTLPGFGVPDEVHVVTGPGLADTIDLLPSDQRIAPRLPPIDEELVGRVDEFAAVSDALSRASLVTLVGVGGMGKTRLALEVAVGAVDAFEAQVWWIDLSVATADSAVLPVAMASAGVRETAGRTALEAFTDRFEGVDGLLVLDNCEHVLHAACGIVDALRSAAPTMRVIATSREALGLRGEHVVPIGSLPLVDGTDLFVDRALAVRPELDVAADAAAIERICSRLDGIPLAIELAAARCRSLTPAEIDARLDDRFRLLRGGRSGAERHRTLQATVAWSYSLLDADERTVFDQMAVFAGGTLLDGLVAVTGFDEFDVLEIVDRLIARSMVVASRTALGTRYQQLETLRQFAEDQLVQHDTIAIIRDRHLEWVRALAETIDAAMGTRRGGDALRRLVMDVDNLRVAVAHAIANGRHRTAQEIAADVAMLAIEIPAWEVLDWVRPLHLADGWTDAAIVCAAVGAHIDEQRTGPVGVERPLGGVPTEALRTHWVAALFQTSNMCSNGAWREALALVESTTPHHDVARSWLTCSRLWAGTHGFNRGALTETEFDRVCTAARENFELTAQLGDEYLIAATSFFSAYPLIERDPAAAAEMARRSVDAAAAIGAQYNEERSRAVMLTALAAAVAAGQVPAAEVAQSIRSHLAEALELHHRFIMSVFARAAVRLLVGPEPATAALVAHSFQQQRNAPIAPEVLTALRSDPTFDEASIIERAGSISPEDAVRIAIDALDRVIAGVDAGPHV